MKVATSKRLREAGLMCYHVHMDNVAILEQTKEYVVVKIPRVFLSGTENRLHILEEGSEEYRKGKTKTLHSLRDLR